jgi:hypothetical protein
MMKPIVPIFRLAVFIALCLLFSPSKIDAQSATLLNISSRARVNTSDNLGEILIGGFIIEAPPGVTKRVLLRAIGPSLGELAVPGALADTVLVVYDHGTSIASNDNWRDTQMAAIEATLIPPTDDLESALLLDLGAGEYTAQVYGTVDTLFFPGDPRGAGIALVEIYDLDPASPARLANISTRAPVGLGDDVLIGGFIVGGGTKTVLARAIGPSLVLGGAPSPLADPVLEMHNASGDVIGFNDNWKDDQKAEIEGTTIAPTDDREAAILAALPSGNYPDQPHVTADSSSGLLTCCD